MSHHLMTEFCTTHPQCEKPKEEKISISVAVAKICGKTVDGAILNFSGKRVYVRRHVTSILMASDSVTAFCVN